jgi:tetratricopeptide (TPR) repeat protein/transcriptional regulator with XRE-family HTH domain
MSEAVPTFGDWVRSRRKALGLTQQQLGELVSCSEHAIRKIEAAERRPSHGLAQRLALHLQLATADVTAFLGAARIQPAIASSACDPLNSASVPQVVALSRNSVSIPATLPLVGRDRELTLLRKRIGQLRGRRGRMVFIDGEPGAGKSRLLAEVVEQATRLELPVISTKCFEIEARVPYYALVRLIVQAADVAGVACLQRMQAVSRGEIATVAPVLAPRLQPLPEPANEFPDVRRVRLFAAIVELFEALAGSRGLVIVVDDLQWLDDASAQALHSVARHAGTSALLVVGAARSEEARADPDFRRYRAAFNELEHADVLALARLNLGEVGDLLERLLGGGAAEPAMVKQLYHESAGNPFYLREMLHVVLGIQRLSGSAETVEAPARRILPSSLQAIVRGRLDRLSTAARSMLDAAAVLGRRLEFGLLHAMLLQSNEASLDALDELLRREWLVEDQNGGSYDFAHDKLREAVYHEMTGARRAWLHGRAAECMLATSKDSAETMLHALIAEHAEQAGLWPLAIEQRTVAGEHAERVLGLREAESHYTLALAHCVEHLAAAAGSIRNALLERRGAVRSLLSEVDLAAADLRAAIANTDEGSAPFRRQHLLTVLGMTFQRADRYDEGTAALNEALALARTAQDHQATALANYWLGDIAWTLERNKEARQYFEEVMRACQQHDLGKAMLAKAYHGIGEVASLDARPQVALEHFELSLQLSEELGDRFQQCENLTVMGWMHHGSAGSGDYAQAFVEFDRCLAIAQQSDMGWYAIPCLIGRGAGLAALGCFEEALACFDDVMAMLREVSMPRWEAMVQIWLASCRLDMGLPEEALEHAQRARACIDSAGVFFFSHLLPGIITTALSRTGRACEVCDPASAIADARRAELSYAVLTGLLARVEWLHAQGDTVGALACADELECVATAHAVPEMISQAKYWRAEALAAKGDGVAAARNARELLAGMKVGARFSLRLALLRLVVRLSGSGESCTEEVRALRAMESQMTGGSRHPS